MKATLLASTPNATKLVATAAWICTHPEFPTKASDILFADYWQDCGSCKEKEPCR